MGKLNFKDRRAMNYRDKSLERDIILFNWKSDTMKLPLNPEFWLTAYGALGWDKVHNRWVTGSFSGLRDELGDFTTFVYFTLNNTDVSAGTLKNHEEVIVCGNTPLYRPFNEERYFYSEMKAEADTSIRVQLLLSRLNKAIIAANDQQKKQIIDAYKNVIDGNPVVITTSIMDELDTLDLTDNDDIQKMQYLSTFFQTLEKREANDFGVDLDLIDKRAQVTNEEVKQYDDVTTLEYLIMFEMRKRFVEEMKENGFELEIVRNPVFFDEPEKEDIDEGTFEAAEAPEETPEENTEKEGGEDAGNDKAND